MLTGKTIGFIGAGNMAQAIIAGLVHTEIVSPANIIASAPRAERRLELAEALGIAVVDDNREVARRADVVVIAVKPQVFANVAREVAASLRPQAIVVSVAAGLHTQTIEGWIGDAVKVVRAMPNTPALVKAGATVISAGARARAEDVEVVKCIFDAVGLTIALDEVHLDAVTGLSGSGPAYIFLILEALADAGVKVGLARRHALALAAQTVMGSAKLLLETGEHPGQLKDMVTSPGGTAIAGLHTLEQGGLRTTLINAVETATKRARELGNASRERDAPREGRKA